MRSNEPPGDRTRRATNLLFRPDESFTLDQETPVPLYYQMERIILDRISSEGEVGKMLPPEVDLMRMFHVSRATVQKTTQELVSRGLIRRRRARGTEIISLGLREDLGRLTSYTEQMARRGLQVSTRILEVAVVNPPLPVRERLRIEARDKVISIQRLRGTSKVFPVVLLHSYIPASTGLKITEDYTGSLYKLMEEKHGVPILYADQSISARGAAPDEARHLGIANGSPVLAMERVSFTTGDRPIEYVHAVYRPEHYVFSIRLKR